MLHMGSDHRSVAAHFSFPDTGKKGLASRRQKQNPCQDTRYTMQLWSHAMSPSHQQNHQEVEQRYDGLEKRLIGERQVAAHEESEIRERQHATMTAAAAEEESRILERQHTKTTTAATEGEEAILEQHTMKTAAQTMNRKSLSNK